MAHEEDDDLYDEEFDFVDDDDIEEDEVDEASPLAETSIDDSEIAEEPVAELASEEGAPEGEEGPMDEYGRPEQPPANYIVHVYENRKFKHTIERPFTPEDAEAFATEFNRTSKNYDRVAVTSKNDAKPKKTLD